MSITHDPGGTWVVHVAGDLRRAASPDLAAKIDAAATEIEKGARVTFDATALEHWDSSLLIVVRRLLGTLKDADVEVDTSGLPDGVQKLIAMSQVVAAKHPPAEPPPLPWLARLGQAGIAQWEGVHLVLVFLGELAFSIGRLATGRARMRKEDLLHEIQSAGVQSFGIVAIVSFLLGMILAFVGGVTLRPFGATIYVANVVTVAMLRELGAVMTAIVMSGRTGSAYAAQIGTMKVTQEIDALTTMALPPSDFLVMPRVLALSLMMPILVIYADFVASLGGGVVAILSGAGPTEYFQQVRIAATLSTFWIGVGKSVVFGIIVAVCGCIQGLRASGGAQAVGNAATSAVVTSIIWIIAVDGLFAVVLDVVKL